MLLTLLGGCQHKQAGLHKCGSELMMTCLTGLCFASAALNRRRTGDIVRRQIQMLT